MRYRLFSVGLPTVFVVGATVLVMAFDYVQRTKMQDNLAIGAYVMEIPGRLSRMFDNSEESALKLAGFVPQTVPGWSGRPTVPNDHSALGLSRSDTPDGYAQEAVTFTRNDRVVILTVTLRPGDIAAAAQTADMPDVNGIPFAAVQGVTFMQKPMQEATMARRMTASLGTQLHFDLVTTGTDEQTMLVLGAADMVAFNALLENPVATVDPDAGAVLIPRAPAPRQTVATPAAPAESEAQVVRRSGSGVVTSENCTISNGIRRCTVSGN